MASSYLKKDNISRSKKIKKFRKTREYPLLLDDANLNIKPKIIGFHIKLFYDPDFFYKTSVIYDFRIPTYHSRLDKKSYNITLPVLKTSVERKVIALNANNKEIAYTEEKEVDSESDILHLILKYDDFPVMYNNEDEKTYYYARIELESASNDLPLPQNDYSVLKETIFSILHKLLSKKANNDDNLVLNIRFLKLLWKLICIYLRPQKTLCFSLSCGPCDLRDRLLEYSISMPLGWDMCRLIDPNKNYKYTDNSGIKSKSLIKFSVDDKMKQNLLFHQFSSIVDGIKTYYYKVEDEWLLRDCMITIIFQIKVTKWVNYFSLVPIILVIMAGWCSISIITSPWEMMSKQLAIYISYFILFLAYCYTHITLRHNGYNMPHKMLLRNSIIIIIFILVIGILGRLLPSYFIS